LIATGATPLPTLRIHGEGSFGRKGFLPGEIFLEFLEVFEPGTPWALEA